MEKKLQKLLNLIADYNIDGHCPFHALYQGMEIKVDDRALVFDGGSGHELFNFIDVHMLYYKNIFFICSENYIMFFEQERLVDYLTGALDEFWGLFPNDFRSIVYEQEILEMQEYFVDKEALRNLAFGLKMMPKTNKED
jgi:hypothetical protein